MNQEPGAEGPVFTPLRFVLHEHFARHHHYDFRLEKDNVLKSWALPKGLPERSKDRRLAIETEDHELSYIRFEGSIPEGEYGAGEVKIADEGTYRQVIWSADKIEVVLDGQRFSGTYVFVRFTKAGRGQWLLMKRGEKKVS
jgi:DNA ligase D-like protein (predicted 3'-phosphoesterase)